MSVSDTGRQIAVVVCSVGRPGTLAGMLPWLGRQALPPSEVILVVTKPEDLPPAAALQIGVPVRVVISEKGLARQRNHGLDAVLGHCDVVFFIDDDYLPSRDALQGLYRTFSAFPKVSGVTGLLLADGIHGQGIDLDEAATLISEHEVAQERPAAPEALRRGLVGLYGCNMAYRADRIGMHRFDERLPLYGWQEDVDFASRIPGEKIQTDAVVGVHCGVKSGRELSGHALGYSQVANVAYLIRKGTVPFGFGMRLMMRNIVANHLKSLAPESWVDRRGRARGNRMALVDLLRGRDAPERILDMQPGRR